MVNKDLKKNSKIRTVNMMIQSALIIILIVLVANMMVEIKNLQGTARVINYAGLVRGATQRAVKLEVIGNSDDELIEYLDDVLADLKYEDGEYNLVSLRDTDYQKKLDIQIDYWGKLKNEINNVRENGVDNSDIVDMSEMYFSLADQTVSAAERYSEDIADNIHFIETITVIDMAGQLLLIIIQMIQAIIIVRKNKVLEQKAYLDAHTGLPNKSRCEEVFHDLRFLDRNVACIMFDLNNLKIANDTLGHSVGDQLIVNFANILRNATSKSLIILDEIGRGTSTFDGLSIAWAVVEYIANTKILGAKTLFATHYHELTELEGTLDGVNNYCIAVKECGDDIVFLRKIIKGGADKSYGIQVAKLAGVPETVLNRAKELVAELSDADISQKARDIAQYSKKLEKMNNQYKKINDLEDKQMSLFDTVKDDDIISDIKELDISNMTPIDALNTLYKLQGKVKNRW